MTTGMVMGIFAVFAVLLGLSFGSFANVAIHRLGEDRSVWWPPSHCPHCAHPIRKRDNIPVVSYVLLGGQCRDCPAPIPASYPLIELLGGLLGLLLFWRIFPTPEAAGDPVYWAAWFTYMTFLILLVIGSFIDLRHWIIPDEVTIYAVPAGIALVFGLGWLGYDGALAMRWRECVWAAVLGGGFFGSVSIGYFAIRGQQGLGAGDVKLLAMIGSFLGVYTWIALVVGTTLAAVSSLAQLAWTRRSTHQPAGPAFSAGAIIAVLYGDVLIDTIFPGVRLWQETLANWQ